MAAIVLIILIIIIVIAVSKPIKEKKKVEFKNLTDLTSHESEQLQKAQSAIEFVNIWNSLIRHVSKIQDTYKSTCGRGQKKNIDEVVSSLKELRNSEEFYVLLRDAIARNKRRTIKNIRSTYKNSEKLKQSEYQKFCEDIDATKHIYNEETTDFANACIDEVKYALNYIPSRKVQDNEEFVAEQRRLITPSLRYDIMKRDGFRCVICGRGADDGVKLHVDHIKPVSKGGLSTPSNLRTLCQDCNLGKSAKYDPND